MAEGRVSGPFHHVRIDTWKSIARYLGRSSRTIQRWHREYGLPVHRLGVDTGSIFAYADELDSWLRNRESTPKNTIFEIPRPAPLRPSHLQTEPDQTREAIEFPQIPSFRRQRSAALVAFAHKLWESLSSENLKTIAKCFREAIDLDPGNAEAYAGLSHALIAEGLSGILRIPAAYVSAKAALERGVELNGELPETQCAASWLNIVLDRDWHGARAGLDDSRNQLFCGTRALVGRALLHIAEGCPQIATGLLREAVQQNPLNAQATALYCWSTYLAEEYGDALELVEESRAHGQSEPLLDAVEALASVHWLKPGACIPRIEALVADAPHQGLLRGVLGYVLAMNGHADRANAILDAIARPVEGEKCATPYAIALILIGLDEKHDAVQWLEQSYRNGSLWSLGFPSDPILKSLRDEPSYRMFLGKVRYPALSRRGPISEGSSAILRERLRASGA